jgi:HAD superfamily hydrolase (TIGR01509 family)
VPLLLVDLDDTLVGRAATVHRFLRRRFGLEVSPGPARLLHRLGLHRLGCRLIVRHERHAVRSYALEDGVAEALQRVRRAGWSVAVVTNGNRRTQPAKIAAAGLAPLVETVVISSHEGLAKPDARVFRLAAERAGTTLEDAWLIGDDLRQEIAGGARLGLRSVWLNPRGRPANGDVDLQARSFPEAVDLVLNHAARGESARPPRAPSADGPGRSTGPT